MPGPSDRFTPDELKQLIAMGELKTEDIGLLHPHDQRVAISMMPPDSFGEAMGAPLMPPIAAQSIASAPSLLGMAGRALGIGGGAKAASGTKPPSRPPTGRQGPSNLERHGNLTRPGPDAHKGGGGPSRPSPEGGPIRNPANEPPGFKGPTGDDANFKTLPNRAQTPPERRAGDRRKTPRIGDEVTDRRYAELRSLFGGQPGKRLPPSSAGFDEAEKRKVMFGGLGPGSDQYRSGKRSPLSPQEIKRIIDNIMKMDPLK